MALIYALPCVGLPGCIGSLPDRAAAALEQPTNTPDAHDASVHLQGKLKAKASCRSHQLPAKGVPTRGLAYDRCFIESGKALASSPQAVGEIPDKAKA
jgi:hypothetical protein